MKVRSALLALAVFITMTSGGMAAGFTKNISAPKEPININDYNAFLDQEKGTPIVKEWTNIGSIRKGSISDVANLDAVIAFPLNNNNEKFKGLRIKVDSSGRMSGTTEAVLAYSQLEALSKALGSLINASQEYANQEKELVEVTYSIGDDFRVGFSQEGKKQKSFISCGGKNQETATWGDAAKLNDLKKFVDLAIAYLKTH